MTQRSGNGPDPEAPGVALLERLAMPRTRLAPGSPAGARLPDCLVTTSSAGNGRYGRARAARPSGGAGGVAMGAVIGDVLALAVGVAISPLPNVAVILVLLAPRGVRHRPASWAVGSSASSSERRDFGRRTGHRLSACQAASECVADWAEDLAGGEQRHRDGGAVASDRRRADRQGNRGAMTTAHPMTVPRPNRGTPRASCRSASTTRKGWSR